MKRFAQRLKVLFSIMLSVCTSSLLLTVSLLLHMQYGLVCFVCLESGACAPRRRFSTDRKFGRKHVGFYVKIYRTGGSPTSGIISRRTRWFVNFVGGDDDDVVSALFILLPGVSHEL